MQNSNIRLAADPDLSGILDLYSHLHPEDPHLDPIKARETWGEILGSGLVKIFVAEMGGLLVSSCTMSVIPNLTRSARPYALIENVVTREESRKTGLGRAVLAFALNAAWGANCYKVMLATGSQRLETLRFYEGAGFKRGGKTYFQANNPALP